MMSITRKYSHPLLTIKESRSYIEKVGNTLLFVCMGTCCIRLASEAQLVYIGMDFRRMITQSNNRVNDDYGSNGYTRLPCT